MRLKVIEGKCAGHARCATVAPGIFVLNDDGYMEAGIIDVPPGAEALAQRGMRACPERAIAIVED